MNNFQLSKNFNLQEFECTHPDHRHVRVDEKLVDKLQKLRDKINKPLVINSAYRCPERNEQVGGAKDSQHLYGKAVDVSVTNLEISVEKVKELAEKIGFNGIGLYDTFIHLDVRGYKARWDERK
ncbi:MAG: YcbK family protein [bacterium]